MKLLLVLIGFCAAALATAIAADENELAPLTVKAEETPAEAVESEETESEADGSKEALSESPAAKVEEKEKDPRDEEIKELRKQRDLLSAKALLRGEKLKAELVEMKEEKDRLAAENALFREKMTAELQDYKMKMDRMDAEADLINQRIQLATAQAKEALMLELAELKMEEERLNVANSVAQKKIDAELSSLRLADTKLKLKRGELDIQVAELQAKLAKREKTDLIDDLVNFNPDQRYLKEPFVNGQLNISDRRVSLNGLIWSGLASYVDERINYFNNQSIDYPIFIVIDASPGGSVMAGYKILKAMEGSQAPVYVVVKSYAASMAATIATLAERSFAYPNAIILHHQLSWSWGIGNLTQQRETVDEAEEWWRRLAHPVATKMGLELEEFIKLMYEKNSNGDWSEFADDAKEYGWIDHVVNKIWETSVDKNPDRFGGNLFRSEETEERIDADGNSYMALPKLGPFDFYFMYNPDGYYRLK